MYRLAIALIAVLVLAAPAAAQQAPAAPLTLEEAVAEALTGSYLLGAADAGVGAAEAGAEEARAARLPKIELTEDFARTTNPVQVFSGKLGQEAFSAADFDPALLNNPDAFTDFATRLTLFQPLWTGGRLASAVAAAELGRDAAVSRRERTRQEVVHQVIEAYSLAVVARHQLAVAQEARETSQAHVKLVRDLREAGLVVESDLLQAQVRLAEIEEMVIRAEAAVAVSSAALNLAMGRELGTPVEPVTEIEPAPAAEESLEALVDEALAARPDLAATAAQVAAAERQVAAARAQRLPEVGFMGAVEAHGEDHPFAADGDNWSLGVGVRWTAFDGLASGARIRRAEQSRRQAEQLATFEVQRAALEVRSAYHELEAAGKRIEQAERAVELAAASLEIVEDRYENGLATLVELLEAETSLTEAKSRRVATRRDLLIAQATLDLAVGRL